MNHNPASHKPAPVSSNSLCWQPWAFSLASNPSPSSPAWRLCPRASLPLGFFFGLQALPGGCAPLPAFRWAFSSACKSCLAAVPLCQPAMGFFSAFKHCLVAVPFCQPAALLLPAALSAKEQRKIPLCGSVHRGFPAMSLPLVPAPGWPKKAESAPHWPPNEQKSAFFLQRSEIKLYFCARFVQTHSILNILCKL